MKLLEYFKSQKEDKNFNLLPDGIVILEQDGKVVDANDKALEMLRQTKFNVIGKYFSDLVENGTSVLNKVIQNNQTEIAKAIIQKEENDELPNHG